MKKNIIPFIAVLVLSLNNAVLADSLLNCKSGRSVSLGYIKEKVRMQCGEPQRTEELGYIDKIQNEERIRVMKIEEWIYIIDEHGGEHHYSLVFEGNELVKIEDAGSP